MRLASTWSGLGLSLSLLLATGGCSQKRTEVIIGLATDLDAPSQIDHIRLSVLRMGAEILRQDWDISGLPAQPFELPGSYGVYSTDGSEPQIEVDLTGFSGPTEILHRSSILSLIKEQTLFLRMALVSVCVNKNDCASDQTCVEGNCMPRMIDVRALPQYATDMEKSITCSNGLVFKDTSSKQPMPMVGAGCSGPQFCTEGTCYTPPGSNKTDGGLARDGGSDTPQWIPLSVPASSALLAVAVGKQDIFAVGQRGAILHGGLDGTFGPETVMGVDPSTLPDLRGVFAFPDGEAFAVSAGGDALHRLAGQWTLQNVSTATDFNGVWASSPTDVWAAGASGTSGVVFHFDGSVWAQQAIPQSLPLAAISGLSTSDIWAVGSQNTVLHWDGGIWGSLPPDVQSPIPDWNAVFALKPSFAVFAGSNGRVVFGGSPLMAPTTQTLRGLFAPTQDEIYAVGDNGTIVHIDMTSQVLELQQSNTSSPLFGISGDSPNDLYAVGNGVVLHSTGSGSTIQMPDAGAPDASLPGDCVPMCTGGSGPDCQCTEMCMGHQYVLQCFDVQGMCGCSADGSSKNMFPESGACANPAQLMSLFQSKVASGCGP